MPLTDKILIVEDSPVQLRFVRKNLEPYQSQFIILTAANGQEAVEILSQHSITTLITDLYMPKMDGMELLEYMRGAHPKVPCIVVSAFSSPELLALLNKKHIYQFIEKPADEKELVTAVLDAKFHFEEGSALDGLSVDGAVQFINMRQKSCILEVTSPTGEKGVCYFVEGAFHEAECLDLTAEEAAITMMSWDKAVLRFKRPAVHETKKQIGSDLQTLIAEAARKKETRANNGLTVNKSPGNLLSVDLFSKAVQRATCFDYEGARQILTALLRRNPRDGKAWLWFSRVATSMKPITTALNNVSLIMPDDPEYLADSKKVQLSCQAGCLDTREVQHCPFCWAPVIEEFIACPYCRSHLMMDKNLFDAVQRPDSKIIKEAIHAYAKIILVENNVKAHYHLSLAHANLGHWDEALDHLHKIIKLDPENIFYKQQLRRLLDHMAKLESTGDSDADIAALAQRNSGAHATSTEDVPKRILVVDDSALTRKVVRVILTQEGFEVIEAKNGIEALARFNELTPDMVLLDIIMPGMDGYEVLATLKKNSVFKKIPVIMLTARDSLMDKIKGKMSASDEYLTKPFTPEDLMAKIKKYLA